MAAKTETKFREYHRYLGFFLAGIMAIYAISGIVLTFRDTDWLRTAKHVSKEIEPGLTADDLGPNLRMRVMVEKQEGDLIYFNRGGSYNTTTGVAEYDEMSQPWLIEKMNNLHKMTSSNPLSFLAVFFGLALLFFSVSAFFMFKPSASAFKKGMYFAVAGAILTIILILV